jgi:hypothetical protein
MAPEITGKRTDRPAPKRYWSVLKTRLKQEGIEGTTICSTLKLLAQDGKMRQTDVASKVEYKKQAGKSESGFATYHQK